MAKRLTQEEWIKRAKDKHGDLYDYSLVEYINKETKVTIICKEHGPFEQIPNNHIRGKGCAECAPNARLNQKSFIKKANKVHDNKYDYSLTKFTRTADKVIIICSEHGVFEQEANSHLRGSICPDCADISRSEKVANHPTRAESIRKTNMERYGVPSTAMIPEVRQKQIDTMIQRYGVDNFRHSKEYDVRYKQTMMEKYGVPHYSQTEEFKNKTTKTLIERYGVDNYAKSKDFRDGLPEQLEKSRQTQLERYGAEHFTQSEVYQEMLPELLERNYASKRKNNSFNTSIPEKQMAELLIILFGKDDVSAQYKDERYPFMCDFYIHSRDLFIELNATWTHGNHWFDLENDVDANVLGKWSMRDSDYYTNAIRNWTERDVIKRSTARENNLNYLTFWDENLIDFQIWISMGMPDGKDYEREYSWLKSRDLTIEKRDFKKPTQFAITQQVRYYQQDVFYEKELALWDNNPIHKNYPLQMKLYMNRYKYLDKAPYELTDKQLLSSFAISGIYRGFSSFDTTLMDKIIKKYQPTHIYDPFAGWGERMIISAHNNVSYEGVDINEKLENGYTNIINDLDLKNVSFSVADSLSYTPHENTDMIITCPPYHDVEIYSDKGLENTSYDEFLELWGQLVERNKDVPMFCFQINQKYKKDMQEIVESFGFEFVESFVYDHNKASHLQRKGSKNFKKEYEEMIVLKNKNSK